jgi:hypothetical protein
VHLAILSADFVIIPSEIIVLVQSAEVVDLASMVEVMLDEPASLFLQEIYKLRDG